MFCFRPHVTLTRDPVHYYLFTYDMGMSMSDRVTSYKYRNPYNVKIRKTRTRGQTSVPVSLTYWWDPVWNRYSNIEYECLFLWFWFSYGLQLYKCICTDFYTLSPPVTLLQIVQKFCHLHLWSPCSALLFVTVIVIQFS